MNRQAWLGKGATIVAGDAIVELPKLWRVYVVCIKFIISVWGGFLG